jgi:hypothetical protein
VFFAREAKMRRLGCVVGRGAAVVSIVCALGCDERVIQHSGEGAGGSPGDTLPGLASILVAPTDQTIVIDGDTPAIMAYHATGVFRDGHREDITTRAQFALSDAGLGSFAGGTLTTQTLRGGATSVVAAAGGVQGTTGVTIVLRKRVNDPGSGNLPPDPGGRFGGGVDPARAPQLVYPADGVLLPPNLAKLELHFYPGSGNTLFELSLSNQVTDIRVYLRCTNPLAGGCIYLPDPTVWTWLAETNRGRTVTVELRGTDDAGGAVGQSATQSLGFARDNIMGGIYYWTTSSGSAIMRFDFGSLTQRQAEQFLTTNLTNGRCIGCHALSRDGHKMVIAASSGPVNDLLLDVRTRAPLVPFPTPQSSFFESWNPDGTRYVGVYNSRANPNYNLQIFDGTTGRFVQSIAGTGTAQEPADDPDWSADGTRIAFTRMGDSTSWPQWASHGSIQMVMGSGDAFGAPIEIVPAQSGKNRYYPAFSPDGALLVFDESTCMSGDSGSDCDHDTDPTARLYIVRAAAGASPIELARANAGGPTDGQNRDFCNSFPKWSPFVFQRTGEEGTRVEWLTFSSKRKMGLRSPPPSSDTSRGPLGTLIWMTAVDPDRAIAGDDPSLPAFALPFQDLTTSNHIAQWTSQVVTPPM